MFGNRLEDPIQQKQHQPHLMVLKLTNVHYQ